MRGFLRIALVWLAAVAFAANGIAGQQCLAAQPAPAPVAAAHHGHAGSHDIAQAGHDHHQAAAGQQIPADPGQLPASNHNCGKCLCVATGIIQSAVADELTFVISPVSFSSLAEYHRDRPIDPEPGIPKL
jgi:bacterioferritin-associated ferredoxin